MITPEEYLRLERVSEEKHEYIDGQMLAMAGANRKHRKITANIHFALLAKEAEFGCVSDNSDTRLFIPGTRRYTWWNSASASRRRSGGSDSFAAWMIPSLW